ncbi:ATP-binding protein [Methylobacterium currus]|uniref:sensor histidine kinase n=1 Tax=Methylobacterium currus TaxID=2051553 RepID=UPI001E4CD256|nr:ATP-binding protein [Methylobacterium currus]UHC14963.1 ATP-binding protein [Methylobacterium currus]
MGHGSEQGLGQGSGQVFSRWPSLASAHAGSACTDALPAWMHSAPRRRWPGLVEDGAKAGLAVLVPALLAGWGIAAGSVAAAGAGLLAAVFGTLHVARLRRTLRASEARFSAIFERAGISMWREDWSAVGEAVARLRRAGVADLEGYFAARPAELRALCGRVLIRDVNAFTLEETGARDKAAFLGPLDRLLPETDQTFMQWLVAIGRGDRFFRSEAHIVRADGQQSDVLFTAMLPRDCAEFSDILVTSLDITAYKQAQARLAAAESDLARAARSITVGAVSASIAHEVNTPLAAIAANAQAALRWLKRPEPDLAEVTAALTDVVSEARRARDVVARTRSLFGTASLALAPVDLVQAAREATLLAERELRANGAALLLSADPGLKPVTGDLVQLEQVLVNLLVNAAQAVAGSAGRRDVGITVRGEPGAVRVTVSDTGPGVPPEQRARIFEPFHSTKPGGMGMGLAICRSCIDAHGGDLWLDEAPGGGAAFHVRLPTACRDPA